jgi:hypothetical protein
LVFHEIDDADTIYRCIQAHAGGDDAHYVTDTDYWALMTDTEASVLYPITSKVWTRFFDHRDEASPKKWNRCQVLFGHQRPQIDLDIRDEDHGTSKSLFSDVEYDYTEYDIANTPDWQPDNENLDFNDPHRKDYPWYIPSDGFYMDADDGIFIGIFENHSLRFIPRLTNNNSFSVMITNHRGSLRVKSVVAQAQGSFFAKRNR